MIATPLPFLPSFAWYARYVKALLEGCGEDEARQMANLGLPVKEFPRTRLNDELRLKVPLEGSSSVKRLPIGQLTISGHGDWRKSHLGAFSAIFGRAPYYHYLIDEIEGVYGRFGEAGLPLIPFAEALHLIFRHLILPEGVTEGWRETAEDIKERVKARGAELLPRLDPNHSIIAAAMQLGHETFPPLLWSGSVLASDL